jgi:arylsulfatase
MIGSLGYGACSSASEERPNIVLIVADDMGYSDVGCYGGEIATPHIDGLANQGLRFARFYNNALCGPTRASLLTGLYPAQAGLRGDLWTGLRKYERCVTIAELLQNGGYHTMMVGKWQDEEVAARRGFDRSLCNLPRVPISYFNEIRLNPFFLDEQQVHPTGPARDEFFLTDYLTDHAVEFLNEAVDQEKPFFLYAAFIAPHYPLHAREKDIAKYRSKYLETGWDKVRSWRYERLLRMGLVSRDWRLPPPPREVHQWAEDPKKSWQAERMAAYAAQVHRLDRNIGRILEVIERAGAADNTLVVFLSDNGAAPDGGMFATDRPFSEPAHRPRWRLDGGEMRRGSNLATMPGPANTFAAYGPAWANVSNTPFRGYKWTGREGGIISPLIVRWPAAIQKGGVITSQVGHVMDIMATCLEVAGLPYPKQFQGRNPLPLEGKSLVPIFRGEQRRGHDTLCWFVGRRAIRMGEWKLVSPGRKSPWELYDMEKDGTELSDLAAQHPLRVERMLAEYQSWAARVGLKKGGEDK